MSPEMNSVPNTIFSPELAARFDKLVTLYPARRSALIPMLLYAQDEVGAVNDAVIAEIAQRIGITELVPMTTSLEELFLAMTGGESSDQDQAAA